MVLQKKINDLKESRNVILIPKVREGKSENIAFPNCLFWDKRLDVAVIHGRTWDLHQHSWNSMSDGSRVPWLHFTASSSWRAPVLREALGNIELLIWKHRCVWCDEAPLFKLHWTKCSNFRVGRGRYGRGTLHWCIWMGSEAEADRSYHWAVQKEFDLRVLTPSKLRWKDPH